MNKLFGQACALVTALAACQGAQAGVTTLLGGQVTFQQQSGLYASGLGSGNFETRTLASTSWSNSAVAGGITPLGFSYDFFGQTGTYCDSLGICGWPSYGWTTQHVDLGRIGAAVPLATAGQASLVLSYNTSPGLAKITYPVDTRFQLTQVGVGTYRVDPIASWVTGGAQMVAKAGLPQASLDLNYRASLDVGSLEVCAGGCLSLGGGAHLDSGAQTTNLLDFNAGGKGKLKIPGVIELDPHGEGGDLTYHRGGLSVTVNFPDLEAQGGAGANGQIRTQASSNVFSAGYDVCTLIPYCFNRVLADQSGRLGPLDWSLYDKVYALSLTAGLSAGLSQTLTFSPGAVSGVLSFSEPVRRVTSDGSPIAGSDPVNTLEFTSGQSFYIQTQSPTVHVDTLLDLDGLLHNKTDLLLSAYLAEGVLGNEGRLHVGGNIDLGFVKVPVGQDVSLNVGPLLNARQEFALGSLGLADLELAVQADLAGPSFDIESACSVRDLRVTSVAGSGLGSLLNAIECADVMEDAKILLTRGLGLVAWTPDLPRIDSRVLVINHGNTLVGFDGVHVVPEPGALSLLVLALAAVGRTRTGRHRRRN